MSDYFKKLFTTQKLVLKQQALSEKLQFASADIVRRSLYSSRGLSMSQITTVFLLVRTSHFLVRIIPVVRARGSHYQFAFYRFAISQITKPHQIRPYVIFLTQSSICTL